jgi:5-oxoprolinase (ATP-hydrolysing)
VSTGEGPGKVVRGISGEAVRVMKEPGKNAWFEDAIVLTHTTTDVAQIEKDLKTLYDEGYRSVAIILVHSYTYPEHEQIVGEIAKFVLSVECIFTILH